MPTCPDCEGETLRCPYPQIFADFWTTKFGRDVTPFVYKPVPSELGLFNKSVMIKDVRFYREAPEKACTWL